MPEGGKRRKVKRGGAVGGKKKRAGSRSRSRSRGRK